MPTIRNGTDADTIVQVTTTYTLTGIVSGSEVQIVTQDALDDGTVQADEDLYHLENTTEDDGLGNVPFTTKAVYSYNYISDIPVYIYIHKVGYVWLRIVDTLTNVNKTIPVQQQVDRNYSNP